MQQTATDITPRERLDRTRRQLFLIVGCGRSGTTLLQSMLLSNPDTVIPPETKFYGAFYDRRRLYGDLADEANFRKVAQRVWEDQTRRGVETDRDTFLALADATDRTWEGLFLAVLAAYAQTHDASRVGEKSPVHTHFVGRLAEGFPEAKFIHILRDPRAVVLSRMTAGFGTSRVAPNIRRWRKAVEMHREHADRLGPDRYLLVRYEDLVTDPRPVLDKVCALIGMDLTDAMLEPHKRERKGFAERSAAWMANTLKPISTSSLEKWRTKMSPRHIALTEHALRREMAETGYEPSGARTPLPGLQLLISDAAGAIEHLWGMAQRGVRKALRGGKPAPVNPGGGGDANG